MKINNQWYAEKKEAKPSKIKYIFSEKNQNYDSPTFIEEDRNDELLDSIIDVIQKYISGEDYNWNRVAILLQDMDFLDELKKYIEEDPFEMLETYRELRDESISEHIAEAIKLNKKAQNELEQQNNNTGPTQYGDVPDINIGYIGGSDVDDSEVESVFGGDIANEAISLVQKYFGNLLTDIAKISVTEDSSVFGVFETELTNKIINNLVSSGAIDEIKAKEFLDNGKGVAFRVNPSKIEQEKQSLMDSSEEDRQRLQNYYPDLNIDELRQLDERQILVLALAETLVHEASHAAGYHDEGSAENFEKQFLLRAIEDLNQQREAEGSPPLPVTIKS